MTTQQTEQILTPEDVMDEQPTTNRPRQPSAKLNQGGWVAIACGALVVGLLGGFVVGTQVGKSSSTVANDTGAFGGQSQQGGGMMRRMGAFGTVTAVSDDSITIKDQMQGSTTTYAITSSTTVTNNGSSASVSDIKVDDTVAIQTDNSSSGDSTTATSILLNPSMRGPGGADQSTSGSST